MYCIAPIYHQLIATHGPPTQTRYQTRKPTNLQRGQKQNPIHKRTDKFPKTNQIAPHADSQDGAAAYGKPTPTKLKRQTPPKPTQANRKTNAQLTKADEATANDENEVRREDQEKINRFSRLHQRETVLEEQLKGKQVWSFHV
jgi:hypothetical protein